MQILLAMTVYQIIISGKLPATSSSVPIIGQFTSVEQTTKLEFHHYQCKQSSFLFFSNCRKAQLVMQRQIGGLYLIARLMLFYPSGYYKNTRHNRSRGSTSLAEPEVIKCPGTGLRSSPRDLYLDLGSGPGHMGMLNICILLPANRPCDSSVKQYGILVL